MANLWGGTGSSKKKSDKKTQKYLSSAKQSGELLSDQSSELHQIEKKHEVLEKRFREEVVFGIQRVKEGEKEIYNRQKRETVREIQLLQEEIQALAASVENLDQRLDTASKKAIINPNIYDISFLKKLKVVVKQFMENIEDASLWLTEFNQKGKKKNFWGTFTGKKGGSQFLFSSESYLSRSAG